ncbi:MAG: PAS domain S-box protein [Planctomycetes bacterium]|nr:PAS domain S-box protein [Planctomycetota bacterium]
MMDTIESYRAFSEAVPQIIFELDKFGMITFANRFSVSTFGYTQDEFNNGINAIHLFTTDDREKVEQAIALVLKGEKQVSVELTAIRKDGSTLPISFDGNTKFQEGEPVGVLALLTEIAQSEKSERTLAVQGSYFRHLLENSSDMTVVLDANATLVYASPSLKNVAGYEPHELVGKCAFDYVYPEDIENAKNLFNIGIQIPDYSAFFETRLLRKDGSWRYVEMTGKNLLHEPVINGVVLNFHDIDERKEIENALKLNEEKFRSIFENANDIIIYVDTDGRIIDANHKTEDIGYKRDDILGKTILELEILEPAELERALQLHESGIGSDHHDRMDFEVRQKDGTKLFVEVNSKLIERDGKALNFINIIRDITERKQAEEALKRAYDEVEDRIKQRTAELATSNKQLRKEIEERERAEGKLIKSNRELQESEKKYRDLTDLLPQPIFEADLEGNCTYANRTALETFGFTQEDIERGVNALGLFVSEDKKKAQESISRRLSRESFQGQEYTMIGKDGAEITVALYTDLIVHGIEPVGIRGIAIDITKRRQVEEALRESEEKFRTIFEDANDEIIYIDESGTILDVNKKIEGFWGYTREEIIGNNFAEFDLILEESLQQISELFTKAFEDEIPIVAEFYAKRRDGTPILAEVSARVIRLNSGRRAALVILRDATERKQAEKQLKMYATELQNANEELSHYAYAASHDIGTPLRAIRFNTHLLRKELANISFEDHKGYLNTIDGAVQESLKLAQNLLDLSRLGQRELLLEPIDIGGLLQNVISSAGVPSDVEVVLEENWPTVNSDSILLTQIFRNLIDNAIKFNSNPQKRIEIRWSDAGKQAYEFSISDNGIGIDTRHHEDIFKVFKQLHHKEQYQGAGIGLAIVKKATGTLNGLVRVESELGKGSIFFITIPKKKVARK